MEIIVVGSIDRRIEELLESGGRQVRRMSMSELQGLTERAAEQPGVVVMDLRGMTHAPAALSILRRQHPETPVMIVASSLDPTLMLEAMRAGVTECVVEPLAQAEIDAAIGRVTAQPPTANSGSVFAFIGAKGGVGTTTVAVNVATALAQTSAPTLLADLHLAYGDTALFLGAEPRFSIVDALENTHRLDETFFQGIVVRTEAGLDLLASSERRIVGPVDVGRIRSLITYAAGHYRYTVLDVPRSDITVLDSLESVSTIVIVVNQELATLRSARLIAGALRQRYGRDKVLVAISRYDRFAEISAGDVEQVIGGTVHHMFPNDYRPAVQALNTGRPVVLDGTTKLAASFQVVSRLLTGQPEARREPDKLSGLFSRWTARRTTAPSGVAS